MNNEQILDSLVAQGGPTCLVIKATLEPVGEQDRFQPAGFPEVGHVIYDAPRKNNGKEKVCIIDSAASMANHLESVCLAGPNDVELHADLAGLPYVVCTTDRAYSVENGTIKLNPQDAHDKAVVTSLTEGHRVASDYFLDGCLEPTWVAEQKQKKKVNGEKKEKTIAAHWKGETFRERLRQEFGIVEVEKGKRYFIHPEDWWAIYQTVFKYDPNSLVHGILLAKEQIKISRFLTASLEGFGAARVGRSGVKFDRLGKTLSGQPIFAVDEETARQIRATFILDLALLRSYGRGDKGLNLNQKKLLLGLALWKIKSLLAQPFRYRSQCHLHCTEVVLLPEGEAATDSANSQPQAPEEQPSSVATEGEATTDSAASQRENENSGKGQEVLPALISQLSLRPFIEACKFSGEVPTKVYYPADELFKVGKESDAAAAEGADDNNDAPPEEE
ncbi:MAG: CRISPR-associated protein [Acidobacteria bacterium]|nr:CRISPR-associated protein [Acidobacteriota bacterium]MBI3657495.1 CRISPR-associated protein [Acidobacteriota bacterium]